MARRAAMTAAFRAVWESGVVQARGHEQPPFQGRERVVVTARTRTVTWRQS
ncbi:hypothetical protein ACIHDR_33545 [Nocardia sp. NPDC052278]|uniref:hypothetical protein n=1 Tax=unclassified Nocardia TaxID=2637762 RepID=UPI0036891530